MYQYSEEKTDIDGKFKLHSNMIFINTDKKFVEHFEPQYESFRSYQKYS